MAVVYEENHDGGLTYMSVKIVCDFCDRPLEFDGEGYTIYRTKQINTLARFPHLCKSCADKLDDIFYSIEIEKRRDLIEKVKEVNQARRERLGTKG